jgi:hypothetical protein
MRHAAPVILILALAGTLAVPRSAAQGLPEGPITFADGRVVMSGEVTATGSTASAADEGWFNYSSYEHSTLRNLRIAVAGQATLTPRVSLVGELRTDHLEIVQPYGLFLRIRPWLTRTIDLHVGRVPPTFGAFPRRLYNVDNPVIGLPLAYQYLTSLRTDAVPATADDLIAMRARGWSASYPVGAPEAQPGLPLVNALRWDTGVQARGQHGPVTWLTSVTTGSLSNPRVLDDNRRPQIAGRLSVSPTPAVVAGVSAARGPYLSRSLAADLPAGQRPEQFNQRAIGADLELSHGRWLVRGEALRASWDLPALPAPTVPDAVAAWSGFVEGRVRIAPGVDVATRVERLGFSRVQATRGDRTWDAPVDRLEMAVAWSVRRRLVLKTAWQRNTRDGGLVRDSRVGAFQCIAWF